MGLDKFPDMENSDNKRRYELSDADDAQNLYQSKKPRVPALASVIVEALKVDSLQRFCSSLEPLLRKIVNEEVERALTRLGHANHIGRSSAPRIQGPGERNLQLHFRTRMPPHLFTGGKVQGEQEAPIHVVLVDHNTGVVVQTGPESAAKLNIVVLEGDFNEDAHDDWTRDDFENHEVKEREGKRPLLTGELQLTLKEGVGTLGDLSFTDNSSWIRSRKFRLGLKVAPGYCDGIRVREGKSEAFAVKDHRGELYKKHYPPALHDEVWRLDRIAKDGALHKKLIQANLVTVEDFLRLLVKDPQKLRSILGSGLSNRMWENSVEHAKTCVMGGKLFVYFTDSTHISGVVFNHIYELTGLISNGQFLALESLNHNQKVLVDSMVRKAYENWNQVVEYDENVLGSLDNAKTGMKSSASPAIDNKHVEDRHYVASNQSMQQYGSSIPSVQRRIEDSNLSVSGMVEYPFMRSDHLLGTTTFSNPQQALTGSIDYGNPAVGSSYLPVDWISRQRNGRGLEDIVAEEIRLKSTEMLESDDMQRLLKTINAGVAHYSDEAACFAYSLQYQPQMYHQPAMQDREKTSGKAVVGWLKLKAALRWGIFIRRRAAERRAQLYELD